MKSLLERLIYKITSARFVTTLIIMCTYCWIMKETLNFYSDGKVSKDFFFGLFAGFSAIAGSIVTFYFTRPHKKDNGNKQ